MGFSEILEEQEPSPYLALPFQEIVRLEQYSSGGFHPIHLNEKYASNAMEHGPYRILDKLGDGAYSQVWFGQDGLKDRGVALKFIVARSTQETDEVQINRYLASRPADSLGFHNFLACLDIFQVDGPNGIHDVVVTNPVIFLPEICENKVIEDLNELEILRQIFQGLAFLHEHGVVHRVDLHTGNIAIEFPFLSNAGLAALVSASRRPVCSPCIARSAGPHPPALPTYFVGTPTAFCRELRSTMSAEAGSIVVKLLDFGCAFRPGTSELTPAQGLPHSITAPECIAPLLSAGSSTQAWSFHSDMWTLGCSLADLYSRQRRETVVFVPSYSLSLGAVIAKLLGPVPDQYRYLLDIPSSDTGILDSEHEPSESTDDSIAANWTALEVSSLASRALKPPLGQTITETPARAAREAKNVRSFLSLIERMVKWNPDDRVSAKDALEDPFFRDAA
ncbi:kinase-like domain-containing protein [Mycena filopes]|nr:kinase-like domain-containing protein [Mycena filopes]